MFAPRGRNPALRAQRAWTRGLAGNKLRNDPHGKVIHLKHFPRVPGQFTDFGILPVVQDRLNQLPEYTGKTINRLPLTKRGHSHGSTGVLYPTKDQRYMLSVLSAGHSLLVRGPALTGKTLAVAVHALNLSLERRPRFGKVEFVYTVDSVILVPNDDCIRQYGEMFLFLIKNLPADCCPDRFINDRGTWIVSRRPLGIDLLFTDLHRVSLQTGKRAAVPPQIVVTTPAKLKDVLMDGHLPEFVPEDYRDIAHVAVDGFNYALETTDVELEDNNTSERYGAKNSVRNVLRFVINRLRNQKLRHYTGCRLQRMNDVYAESFTGKLEGRPLLIEGFDYVKWALETETRAIDTENHIRLLFRHRSPRPNLNLLRKLVKTKRLVLYMPIQFAFVAAQGCPMPLALEKPSRFKGSKMEYKQWEHEKERLEDRNLCKMDPQRSFAMLYYYSAAEGTITRRIKRSLAVIGPPAPGFRLLSAVFSFVEDGKTVRDIDTQTHWPADEYYHVSRGNCLSEPDQKQWLADQYAALRGSFPISTVPSVLAQTVLRDGTTLVVVPPFVDLQRLKTMLASRMGCKIGIGHTERGDIIAIHPHTLLTQHVPADKLVVLGLDALVTQFAMSSWSASSKDRIPNIKNPYADLVRFYCERYLDVPTQFVLMREAHLRDLSRMLLASQVVGLHQDGDYKLQYEWRTDTEVLEKERFARAELARLDAQRAGGAAAELDSASDDGLDNNRLGTLADLVFADGKAYGVGTQFPDYGGLDQPEPRKKLWGEWIPTGNKSIPLRKWTRRGHSEDRPGKMPPGMGKGQRKRHTAS